MRDDSVDFALRLLKALHDDCNLARKSSVVPCVGGDNDMIDVGEEFAPYLAIVANDGDDGSSLVIPIIPVIYITLFPHYCDVTLWR